MPAWSVVRPFPATLRPSTVVCDAPATISPDQRLSFSAKRLRREFSDPSRITPKVNSRTVPPLIVTPLCPDEKTPRSHGSSGGQSANSLPSPSMTWPLRSSVTLSAPITMPLLGQSIRSFASFVLATMVCPQVTRPATASAVAPKHRQAAATVATTARCGANR